MNKNRRFVAYTISTLILTIFTVSTLAQDVSIPDPGLNAAIRVALQKPSGPLTQQDLLRLTVLDASRRDVRIVQGLDAAHNLVTLDLQINRLTNFSLPNELVNLVSLDLSVNSLHRYDSPPLSTEILPRATSPVAAQSAVSFSSSASWLADDVTHSERGSVTRSKPRTTGRVRRTRAAGGPALAAARRAALRVRVRPPS